MSSPEFIELFNKPNDHSLLIKIINNFIRHWMQQQSAKPAIIMKLFFSSELLLLKTLFFNNNL